VLGFVVGAPVRGKRPCRREITGGFDSEPAKVVRVVERNVGKDSRRRGWVSTVISGRDIGLDWM